MPNTKLLTQKILQEQGFKKNEINDKLFNDLHQTIQEYFITNIMAQLDEKLQTNYIFMIQANINIQTISDFLNKHITNYNQLIINLIKQLEEQMGVSNLSN